MAILAKDSGNFTPHPEGQYAALCVDVVDLGLVEVEWQGKKKSQHKVRLVFLTEHTLEDGRAAYLSQRFTLSLAEKAALRPFLQAWRGKAFTADELKGFDVEKLIGVPALLQVVHTDKGGKVYDNIAAIMRLPRGANPPSMNGYVRVKDRQPAAVGAGNGGHDGPPPHDEPPFDDSDDLPF